MIAIILGNTSLDLDPNVRVPLNVKASDATSVGEALTSFTNSFDVPWTPNNIKTFENSQNIASQSDVPYRILECRLLLSGRDLFGKSRLVVLEVTEGEGWKVTFLSGDSSLAFTGTLRDLPLSDYDFAMNAFSIVPMSLNNTGVLYAPVNSGVDYLNNSVDLFYNPFQFYAKTLVERIFRELNISLVIKTPTPLFDRVVLPSTSPQKRDIEYLNRWFNVQRLTSNQLMPLPGTAAKVIFNTVISAGADYIYNTGTGVWTNPYPCKMSINAIINYSCVSGVVAPNSTRTWKLFVNGELKRQINQEINAAGTYQVVFNEENVVPVLGGAILTSAYIEYQNAGNASTGDQIVVGSSLSVTFSPDLLYNSMVDVAKSMPDMTQAELLTQICTMSNAMAFYQLNQIIIMPFDRLGSSGLVDLSDKLDVAQKITTNYQAPDIGKVTSFRYSNDSEVESTYGCGKVVFNNSSLKPYADLITLLFAASADKLYAKYRVSLFIPIHKTSQVSGPGTCSRTGGAGSIGVTFALPHGLYHGDYIYIDAIGLTLYVSSVQTTTAIIVLIDVLPAFTNSNWVKYKFEKQSIKPRVALRSNITFNSTTLTYRTGTVVTVINDHYLVTFDGSPNDNNTDGLSWEKLLKKNFLLWLGSLENYKLVYAYMRLTDNDVYQADFTQQYYVKKFGAVFYLQAINKYSSDNESTEVELFRLGPLLDPSKILPL